MISRGTTLTIDRPLHNVKPQVNTQLPLFPDSMTPHSNSRAPVIKGNRDKVWRETSYFGVSQSHTILTRGLLLKHFERIRRCLQDVFNFTAKQREVVFNLLRLWCYYGKCYPTVAMLCREANCSKSTALRVLKELAGIGLIERVHRYLKPYRNQISSLILLHGLLLIIARYLAERGQAFYEKWLKPYLAMPGSEFWPWIIPRDVHTPAPTS